MRGIALELAKRARKSSKVLAVARGEERRAALLKIADMLEIKKEFILSANKKDLERAVGISDAFRDRLTLNDVRIKAMADGVRTVASLRDPVGEVVTGWRRPNGLLIEKVRVPIGVILVIYESRPNVTADAAALTLFSGNAVILRGGKEAFESNRAIAEIMSESLLLSGLPSDSIVFVDRIEREFVSELLKLEGEIDMAIPRGGEGLIRMVAENSRIPVVYHGAGICHVFIDETADLDMAMKIVRNAKCSRPGVCNAMETLLVHEAIAKKTLPRIAETLNDVELRGDEFSRTIVPSMKPAVEEDWSKEYLAKILSIRVVKGVTEAVEHIERYGSHLADSIVTRDINSAEYFSRNVDSSTVFINASTRFTDGGEFGLGAEIGISTQKLHARGPMGPFELTTTKYIVRGEGQIRE